VQGGYRRIVSGANARPPALLDEWLVRIKEELAAHDKRTRSAVGAVRRESDRAPVEQRLDQDLALCEKHKVPMIHHSLGAREELNQAAHGWGGIVFSRRDQQKFAHKAIEKGADGLIWYRRRGWPRRRDIAIRVRGGDPAVFDGPIALSGAIANGRVIRAVRMLGADFAYIGSAFIAPRSQRGRGLQADDHRIDRGRYRLFKSVHRRARQLFEAVDRRGGDGPRQPSGVRRIEDELRHRRIGRTRQAEGLEGNLGSGQGVWQCR